MLWSCISRSNSRDQIVRNMSEEKDTLLPKIKRAVSSNRIDHLISILKAGLATAPFCGGIASLMSDYIPNSKYKRLERFTKQIAEDLERLQEYVDEELLNTDEFAFILEKCFRGVAENYQIEKLEAFRGILVNSAIGIDIVEEEKEYFLRLVNTLSVLHIRMLKFMAMPVDYLNENNIPQENIQGGFSQIFSVAIPGIDLEVIKSAFGDLYQYGLISTGKLIFGTMTASQGLHLLGDRVTVLGKRFIEFCSIQR